MYGDENTLVIWIVAKLKTPNNCEQLKIDTRVITMIDQMHGNEYHYAYFVCR